MLPVTEALNPNAIEIHVCKKIEICPKEELSKEDGSLLFQLLFLSKNAPLAEITEKDKPFLYQVIEKRIKFCFDYQINDVALLLFLTSIAKNPAVGVMYCWYLQYWAKANNVKEINLMTFCEKIFPMGFPSETQMSSIWQGQKVQREKNGGSDNLIDYSTAGKSLQF